MSGLETFSLWFLVAYLVLGGGCALWLFIVYEMAAPIPEPGRYEITLWLKSNISGMRTRLRRRGQIRPGERVSVEFAIDHDCRLTDVDLEGSDGVALEDLQAQTMAHPLIPGRLPPGNHPFIGLKLRAGIPVVAMVSYRRPQ